MKRRSLWASERPRDVGCDFNLYRTPRTPVRQRVCIYKSCCHGSCIQLDTRKVNTTLKVLRILIASERKVPGHQMPINNCVNVILFIMVATCTATPILFLTPEAMLAHPAVIINSAMEDNLPNQLRNNFYKNPSIAAGLAKESWFSDKEMQVIDRETDKIPREKIYSMLHNAGFVRR